MTAHRVRVDHRTGRTRFGDEVRNWQDSGNSSGICPRIPRLERLVKQQQREDLGCGQAHGVHQPLFDKEPLGLERQEKVGKYLLLPDFLKDEEKANDSELPISQKRQTDVAKPLETTISNGRMDRPDRGCVQSGRYVGCAHPDHVRNWNRKEQGLRGGHCDQSRFRTM